MFYIRAKENYKNAGLGFEESGGGQTTQYNHKGYEIYGEYCRLSRDGRKDIK